MSLRADVGRHPFGARVCLQEFRDFLLGKILTICAGVAFRNAPPVGKRHQIKIATFEINDAYGSVVPQTSLNNGAVPIFDPVTVVPEACGGRTRDYENREN